MDNSPTLMNSELEEAPWVNNTKPIKTKVKVLLDLSKDIEINVSISKDELDVDEDGNVCLLSDISLLKEDIKDIVKEQIYIPKGWTIENLEIEYD